MVVQYRHKSSRGPRCGDCGVSLPGVRTFLFQPFVASSGSSALLLFSGEGSVLGGESRWREPETSCGGVHGSCACKGTTGEGVVGEVQGEGDAIGA